MIESPFASAAALRNSCYGRVHAGALALEREQPLRKLAEEINSALRAQIHDPDFPCVGAKSIVNQNTYCFGLYRELADADCSQGLAVDLHTFIQEREHMEGDFKSFIATFLEPKVRTPKQFETLLWEQLALLNRIDRPHYDWNRLVSKDTADATFSFSFAGSPFFVVGLAPSNRRWARRFPGPTLVFNDHEQFERLRREHQFERLKDIIRVRDEKLHGESNTMLADHGAHSEARQYAGRKVRENWRCPVQFQ